jgi:hypothetical protein
VRRRRRKAVNKKTEGKKNNCVMTKNLNDKTFNEIVHHIMCRGISYVSWKTKSLFSLLDDGEVIFA